MHTAVQIVHFVYCFVYINGLILGPGGQSVHNQPAAGKMGSLDPSCPVHSSLGNNVYHMQITVLLLYSSCLIEMLGKHMHVSGIGVFMPSVHMSGPHHVPVLLNQGNEPITGHARWCMDENL